MSKHIIICLRPLFTKMVPVSSLDGIHVRMGLIFEGFSHISLLEVNSCQYENHQVFTCYQ